MEDEEEEESEAVWACLGSGSPGWKWLWLVQSERDGVRVGHVILRVRGLGPRDAGNGRLGVDWDWGFGGNFEAGGFGGPEWGSGTHHALDVADQHGIEDFARFVAVAYIFEGFGAVLATDIEEDFFATAVGELG